MQSQSTTPAEKKHPRIMTLADLRKEGSIPLPRSQPAPSSTPRRMGIFDHSLEAEEKQLHEKLKAHTEQTWKMIKENLVCDEKEKKTSFQKSVNLGTHIALMVIYNLPTLLKKMYNETSAVLPNDPYQITAMKELVNLLPDIYMKSERHCPPAKLLTTPDEITTHNTSMARVNIGALILLPFLYLYWSNYPESSVIGWKGLSYLLTASVFSFSYNNTATYHNDEEVKRVEKQRDKVKTEITNLLKPLAAHLEKGKELSDKLVATLEKQQKPVTNAECLAFKESLRQQNAESTSKQSLSMSR